MSIEATSLPGMSGISDSGTFASPNGLTPDALMIYLQTRLGGLDDQINTIFSKQQSADEIRKHLTQIQNALNDLNDDKSVTALQGQKNVASTPATSPAVTANGGLTCQENPGATFGSPQSLVPVAAIDQNINSAGVPSATPDTASGTAPFEQKINAEIDAIEQIDPNLAAQLRNDLGQEGQILYCQDGLYKTSEVGASREYVQGLVKSLESSSQLEMIQLQSYMSARTTAIQLATNMVNALGEGPKAIASNVGR